MSRALLLASWMLLGVNSQATDEIEPLDGDFLDYLANLEGDEDDWTLLDQLDRKPASQDSENEQSAARKARKEAAKPAVEER